MDAGWRAEAHLSMWGLSADPRLCEVRDTARRLARDVVTPALAAGAADSPGWTAAKAAVLDQCRTGLPACPLQSAPTLSLALVAAELAAGDGGAATCLLSGYLAHSVVRDFGTPEQRDRYLDRRRYPHGALCLTEPPPGAGVDALNLTGTARLVVLPGAAPARRRAMAGRGKARPPRQPHGVCGFRPAGGGLPWRRLPDPRRTQ
jgi:alkylation response protein AidB-like acyl-CoA dehydrogenase